jgi:glutamate formiminotransferase
MNLTDFEQTPVHTVYDEVGRLAASYGVEIARSELIGLLPRKATELAFAHYLKLQDFQSRDVIEQRVEEARALKS